MKRFDTFTELRDFLRKDREEASHCPIRFINVESLEMWMEVKKLLQSMVSNSIFLSAFCEEDDTTPNIHRLKSALKQQSQHVCVSPLSEYLRINPNIAQKTVNDLLSREYTDSVTQRYRIYIPMYRMKSVLQSISINDPRKNNCILLLETGEETDYSLTIIQNSLHVGVQGNSINGFKRYLQYWEQNPDKPLILHTSNAIFFEQNLFFDNVRVIVTSFDLLKYHYDLPNDFSRTDGTEDFWNELAVIMAQEQTFADACCSTLMINRFNANLFTQWATFDDFKKWLLWLWTRIQHKASYLSECAQAACSVDGFVDALFCRIVSCLGACNYDTLYQERKQVLSKMRIPAPASFWETIAVLSPIERIRVLTDTTSKERESVFDALKECPFNNREAVIEVLYRTYPLLANYLACSGDLVAGVLSPTHQEYFDMYRWGKVTNSISEQFYDFVTTIAKQNGESVYLLKSRNAVVSEEYGGEGSSIIFVDGMGIEYIELIANVLSNLDQANYSVSYRVGSCILPSTTEVNKDFLAGRNVAMDILTLDELKHGATYYPDNVVSELEFISTLKEKVQNTLSGDVNRVILTSDHGTSRLAVLVRKTQFDKKYPSEGHEIYKYGRYCIGTDLDLDTAIEYDGKMILADYSRFEQKGAPIDEIHGGASLEEWLVPVITIQKKTAGVTTIAAKKVPADIELLTGSVKKDRTTQMVTVQFKIRNSNVSTMMVTIHGKPIICQKFGDVFQFRYKPTTDEKMVVTQLKSDMIDGSFSFEVNTGIGTNKAFDI